jgi:phosphoenolpyruvate synthase/pyruvate phosphate dikinase
MHETPYSHSREGLTRYRFLSIGRKSIEKIVEFIPLEISNIFNLGFGDLLPDRQIDDKANSNNGDIIKALCTVLHIIQDFTRANPTAKIVFTGSTKERTVLYQRIIKTYLHSFQKEFEITALGGSVSNPVETIFDPGYDKPYLAFFVKRKS